MSTNLPTQIQASVSEDYLKKSTRFFNASLSDIFVELLQNSRRAGAQTITVQYSTAERFIEITDDGVGIHDPSVLLTLGKSRWSEKLKEQEDPAGTGVFSLAGCPKVYFWSHDWFVNFTPEVFTGDAPAVVHKMGSFIEPIWYLMPVPSALALI